MSRPDYSARNFSRATKALAFARQKDAAGVARCKLCTAPLFTGHIVYDHITPWEICRFSGPSNCQAICDTCDAIKTSGVDIPLIASNNRIRDRHIGALTSRHPMPAGRQSKWTKPIGAFRPVRRVSQADKLRAAIERRYGAFVSREVQS